MSEAVVIWRSGSVPPVLRLLSLLLANSAAVQEGLDQSSAENTFNQWISAHSNFDPTDWTASSSANETATELMSVALHYARALCAHSTDSPSFEALSTVVREEIGFASSVPSSWFSQPQLFEQAELLNRYIKFLQLYAQNFKHPIQNPSQSRMILLRPTVDIDILFRAHLWCAPADYTTSCSSTLGAPLNHRYFARTFGRKEADWDLTLHSWMQTYDEPYSLSDELGVVPPELTSSGVDEKSFAVVTPDKERGSVDWGGAVVDSGSEDETRPLQPRVCAITAAPDKPDRLLITLGRGRNRRPDITWVADPC